MRIARFLSGQGPQYGIVQNNQVFTMIGSPFSMDSKIGAPVGSIENIQLLPPAVPGKIICVGRNYVAHAEELGNSVPDEPLLFFKPPSAIIGAGAEIELLPENGKVDHEVELAVVVGRQGRFIKRESALGYILGYTIANDVSDRDYQKSDQLWTRAKGFDTFLPLGPWIETEVAPDNLRLSCAVNGEIRQDSSTSLMVYKVSDLLVFISRIMTLEPGDLILTGTPAGVGALRPGDRVSVSVEKIGVMENSVVKKDI